jgi:hypothetical protein
MEKAELEELIKKLDHRELALWAADYAEKYLHYFEDKYPNDKRPREAIEAARAWARDHIKCGAARKAASAAHAAARDADDKNAIAAARACGHAAATAHVPEHASGVVWYVDKIKPG